MKQPAQLFLGGSFWPLSTSLYLLNFYFVKLQEKYISATVTNTLLYFIFIIIILFFWLNRID